MSQSVADLILEKLTPIYGIPTEIGPDAGSVQELLKRWYAAENPTFVGIPTSKMLYDRYVLAGAVGASVQDKAYDFWSRGLLKSGIKLPGTSGNYLSTPDSVLNSITGDIDIRVCLKMTDWTPAATPAICCKDSTSGGGRSWIWRMGGGSGSQQQVLLYQYGSNASVSGYSGGSVPFADGAVGWLRFTFDADNGAGSSEVKFYYSSDGVTWTQQGSTLTTAGVSGIFDSPTSIELGSRGAGTTDLLDGTIYYAEVRNGIDGPVVVKFDSSQIQVSGAQTPASINGWTWSGSALYKRDDYARLPNTTTGWLTYPALTSFPTSSIDIRQKVAWDDWTPGAINYIMSKYNGGSQCSFLFGLASTGALRFQWSPDGTVGGLILKDSTAAVPFTDGQVGWIRVTLDAAIGQVTFYTSPDGVVWTPLGTLVSAVGATSIFQSTTLLEIGGFAGGSGITMARNVYYAEVRNGINGTVVAYFDARNVQTPWTINGTGWSYEGTSFQGKPVTALQLNGTTGNYVLTPDTAGVSVAGDIDIRVKASLDDWTPATDNSLISKYVTTGNQRSFELKIFSTGELIFVISTTGSDTPAVTCLTLPSVTNGATTWLRVTRVQSTGVTNFYQSSDGVTWTFLNTGTVAVGSAIFDSTAGLEIGSVSNGGARPLAGKIYYAEVRNGIDGPIVAKFDPTAIARTGVRTPTTSVQPGGSPNLLTPNQASIETDATGWTPGVNTPTLARSTAQFLDGVASLSLTATAAAAMGSSTTPVAVASVTPGKLYTAKYSSRAAVTPETFTATISWYTAASGFISNSSGTGVVDTTSGWTECTVTAVAPATAAYAVIATFYAAAAIGEVHYVDRISLVEAAAVWTMNGSAWDLVQVA